MALLANNPSDTLATTSTQKPEPRCSRRRGFILGGPASRRITTRRA